MFVNFEHSIKGTQVLSNTSVVPIDYQKHINKFQ